MTQKLIIGLISFFSIQNSPIYITFLKRRRQIMHKKENVQFIKNSLHHKQSRWRILLLFIFSVLDKKNLLLWNLRNKEEVYTLKELIEYYTFIPYYGPVTIDCVCSNCLKGELRYYSYKVWYINHIMITLFH